jgi:hypothetical protein
MGSWIKCQCGMLLHKNLFSGAGVSLLVPEAVMDEGDEAESSAALLGRIVIGSEVVVQCQACGRVAIERKNGRVEFYVRELASE